MTAESAADPSEAAAHLGLFEKALGTALAHFGAGRVDAACSLATQLHAVAPVVVGPMLLLALCAEQSADHEAELDWYRRAIAATPDNARLHEAAARAALRLGKRDVVREHLLAATATSKDPAGVWGNLGILAETSGKVAEAEAHYRRLIATAPEKPSGYAFLANLLLRERRIDDIDAVIADARSHGTSSEAEGWAAIEAAHQLSRRGLVEAHLAAVDMILAKSPRDFDALGMGVYGLIRAGETPRASELLTTLEAASPRQEAAIAQHRAAIALAEWQPSRAEAILKAALEQADNLNPPDSIIQSALLMQLLRAFLLNADISAAISISQRLESLLATDLPYLWDQYAQSLDYSLLTEFNSNAESALRASSLARMLPPLRAKAAARAMENDPVYQAYGFALLLANRQAGVFDGFRPHEGPPIPRRLMQFWDSATMPPDVLESMGTWQKQCPGLSYELFDDSQATAFIKRHCAPNVQAAFALSAQPAMRADIFRLVWLYVRGGIYTDADDLCRADIEPMLVDGAQLVLLHEEIGSIGNNFLAATAGHPLIGAVLAHVIAMVLQRQGDNVWFLTGPGPLTDVFCRHYLSDLRRLRLPAGLRIWSTWDYGRRVSQHVLRQYKRDDHWLSAKNQWSLFRQSTVAKA